MNEQKVIYSIAWYQPEEWQHLKEIVDDPSSLDDSYEEWRSSAEKAIVELRSNGQSVKKTAIKISSLLTWCESKGVKPDSKARSEYAAFLSEKRSS
ncbi:hypothetical protein [Psychromonas antarctica]|uniref:hypothetical protein n=1 Tax=Psychromonas antarctica TaxID=67573 RepID=UPI001EE84F12|nr:hypothetical protein [Psychromonas antarctica]MCG6202611.1 hypothetical protein [Psychromonas antarctica]